MVPIVFVTMGITMVFLVPFVIWDSISQSSNSTWAVSAAFILTFICIIGLSLYAGTRNS